jgi:hypothetical protein
MLSSALRGLLPRRISTALATIQSVLITCLPSLRVQLVASTHGHGHCSLARPPCPAGTCGARRRERTTFTDMLHRNTADGILVTCTNPPLHKKNTYTYRLHHNHIGLASTRTVPRNTRKTSKHLWSISGAQRATQVVQSGVVFSGTDRGLIWRGRV